MDAAQLADLVWAGVALVIVAAILITRRARRHGGALRAGVVGAMYEWQTKDKQRALDVIVEGRAEARRPEYPDGNLPALGSGKKKDR
ncbi:MAG TPA: hypothetical protein VI589_11635 [Vicinamibacteria bacterium]